MRLSAAAMKDAAEWLGQYRQFWIEQFDSLEAYLATPTDDPQARATDATTGS